MPSTPSVVVITGASRGLGLAMAVGAAEAGHRVVRIGRMRLESDMERSLQASGPGIEWDLAEPDRMPTTALDVALPLETAAISLILNAAWIGPLGEIGTLTAAELRAAMDINVTSHACLLNHVVGRFAGTGTRLQVVFLSSGAARRPIAGWSAYCSGKAAMEMVAACLSVDHPDLDCRVMDPGVMDTGMQAELRTWRAEAGVGGDPGQLTPPGAVAERILRECGLA